MTKEEAKEILSENLLIINKSGLDSLPTKKGIVARFSYKEVPSSENLGVLIGLLDDGTNAHNIDYDYDYECRSFLVEFDKGYYFREYYEDALLVIEALQVANNYKGE